MESISPNSSSRWGRLLCVDFAEENEVFAMAVSLKQESQNVSPNAVHFTLYRVLFFQGLARDRNDCGIGLEIGGGQPSYLRR